MNVRSLFTFATMLLIVSAAGLRPVDGDDAIVIEAEHLHIGDGQTLSPGRVLVQDGKIVEVGDSVSADSAKVIKVSALLPGLVDAAARMGVAQLDDERTKEVTPDLASAAIIDWSDRQFAEQLAAGTTSVHLTPGTSNVIAGLAAAVKTAGPADQRLLKDRTGLMIAMCQDPASGNGSRSRPGQHLHSPAHQPHGRGLDPSQRFSCHRKRTHDVSRHAAGGRRRPSRLCRQSDTV